jgi:hypothetical protein
MSDRRCSRPSHQSTPRVHALQKPTIDSHPTNASYARAPRRLSHHQTQSSKHQFVKSINKRVYRHLRYKPKQGWSDRCVCHPLWPRLSCPRPRLSPSVAASVAASVVDHPALKRSYVLAPNSDFDDLGHFGKLTQRATQPTKALDPVHTESKQYSTLRAIIVSGEHQKTFLSSPS